jgi:2-(1,2-epoxy-1,2-dihydrophenyl)acetyl-CoA isomerase
VTGPDALPPGGRHWQTIELEADGPVAYLRFNRPANRNGVVAAMLGEVLDALQWVAGQPEIGVLALTGNGSTFCPGADLRRDRGQVPGDSALPSPEVYRSAELLHGMPQVTVALVNGACAGAGFAWAAACDLRVAADSARFAVAFLELGLPGELGLAWTLPRQVGGAAARELLFLPRKYSAAELRDLHFIAAVFPQADFAREASQLVDGLAGRGARTLRLLKQNLLDADRLPLAEYLPLETGRHQDQFRGDALAETRSRLAAQAARIAGTGPAQPPGPAQQPGPAQPSGPAQQPGAHA